MIYFLQSPDGGPIKIGYTDNIDARKRQLERYYGRTLVILATIDGGPEEEVSIHSRFDQLRLKGSNYRGRKPEQFRPSPELMAFIGVPMLAVENAEVVEMIPKYRDTDRDDIAVKMDRTLVSRARHIAHYRGVPLAEILSELLRAPLDKAYGQMLREIEKRGDKE